MGAPAFSSPPAHPSAFEAWQRAQRQQGPWKASLGPKSDWYLKLPQDQRYDESEWLALETYDTWLRGDPIVACVYGKDFCKPGAFEKECDIESPDDPRLCARLASSAPSWHARFRSQATTAPWVTTSWGPL